MRTARITMSTGTPTCPAELGFLSNEEDNTYFDTKQTEYAKEIAQAIIDTGKQLNLYKGETAPAQSEPASTEATT